MNKVWLTGDAVVDLIPNGENSYLKCPGGAPANVAVAIARLCGEVGFFGRVGDDPFGRYMKQILAHETVDTKKISLDSTHRTSTVLVELDEHGERSFTFMVKPSADQYITPNDIPQFHKNQWMHCCSIALANEPSRTTTFEAMHKAKNAGAYLSFDPNLREETWSNRSEIKETLMKAILLADVIKFSLEELFFLSGHSNLNDALVSLALSKDKLVIVTLGSAGALVQFGGQTKQIEGKRVEKVQDTTGAGDAFVGGLLAKLAQSTDWKNWTEITDAVVWGNCCGALVTTQKGAMTALPSQKQLLEALNQATYRLPV